MRQAKTRELHPVGICLFAFIATHSALASTNNTSVLHNATVLHNKTFVDDRVLILNNTRVQDNNTLKTFVVPADLEIDTCALTSDFKQGRPSSGCIKFV